MKIEYTPIGVIHSPFTDREGMPIQPAGARGIKGRIEIHEEYRKGLRDLDGFSHVILLYHFHLNRGFKLEVVPFMDTVPHGVFATRAPLRPNALGLSVVCLDGLADGVLQISDVDILDGTPLLDIKPFIPEFDSYAPVRTGWLPDPRKSVTGRLADGRYTETP
jgi:tRNA-Thr(GGU) m(6)t(6)A37 methyltransferase TsaA